MRRLCIVAHGAPMLYGYLIVALGRDGQGPDPIEIVVDRRRARAGAPALERRQRSAVDRELETRGYVVLDENGAIVRALEPRPLTGVAAWKARARRARDRVETAWRSLATLPAISHARDGVGAARQHSLFSVTRVRDGLQSTWQALAAMAQPPTPAPPSRIPGPPPSPGKNPERREPGRLPQRARTFWMLGGAVAAVAAAALFVALEPPDPPDPVAARDARRSASVPAVTVAADGPRAVPSASNGAPPPADGAPAPAVVTAPDNATPPAAVATPTPKGAAARSEPAPDRAAGPSREPPATAPTAAAAPETPPASQASTTRARENPASHQTGAVRETPATRHLTAARSEELAARVKSAPEAARAEERPTPASELDARPSGTPRVELQSDVAGRADDRTITYTARLSDARGRPLVNAEVSLHGWLPDGSDLKARLSSTSTPGIYRASVPVGPRTPSNLRVLVAHGGKRFAVAPQHRAL